MFETLYKDSATIERYRLAPLLEDRERYLCAVLASGAVGEVARRVARAQIALMDLLNLPDTDVPGGFADGGDGCSGVVPERSRGFRRKFPAPCLSLASVSSAGWKSRFRMPIRTPGRWRLSRPGCGTNGGCPKRPSATAVIRATVSSPGQQTVT